MHIYQHYAARGGHEDIVRLLIESRCNVNIQTHAGSTALMRAAYCNHASIAHMLIQAGANALTRDADGRTCLHKAVEGGAVSVVTLLLTHSPDLANTPDNRGTTPRELAASDRTLTCLFQLQIE